MRKINILSNDFVNFNRTLGDVQRTLKESLEDLLKDTFLTESCQVVDILNKKYSPSFMKLSECNYQEKLSEFAKKIYNGNSISLEESIAFSNAINKCLDLTESDDLSNSVLCFSINECNIPESESEYIVEYTELGKQRAIKFIAELQESAEIGLSLINSNDSDNMNAGCSKLAPIFTLIERPAYSSDGDELKAITGHPYKSKDSFERDKKDGSLMKKVDKNTGESKIGVHSPDGKFRTIDSSSKDKGTTTQYKEK